MESFQHQAPNIIITNTKKALKYAVGWTLVPGVSCWTCRRLLRAHTPPGHHRTCMGALPCIACSTVLVVATSPHQII